MNPIYEMKLGDSLWSEQMSCNIVRVPGGWLFQTSDVGSTYIATMCFVPFNNEFMQNIAHIENVNTTTNSDYAAALRVIKEISKEENVALVVSIERIIEERLNSAKAPNCA